MCDKDHFGDLTDDLLWHVLSFLTPDEALQTCVLDTRWRDLWRRTKSLVLIFDDETTTLPFRNIEKLGKLIMQIRGNLPLVKCEIHACPDDKNLDWHQWTFTSTKLLIQYAITCQVNELIVANSDGLDEPLIFDAPYISAHLKTIDLDSLNLEDSALDFSGCPALEDLSMLHCSIYAHKISSKSLKRLSITGYCSLPSYFHIQICTPSLISLQLDDFDGLTPLLEYMPFLVTAYVGLGDGCDDYCKRYGVECDFHDSGCNAYLVKESVILNGLSNAVNLELIAQPKMFIYRQDLKWCPIFHKLRNLLLNEWFTAIGLVCILQHSPALEMLTLQLGDTKKLLKATGAQETTKQSFVCAHLKVVNIECGKVDEGIHKILKILRTCGVLRDHISIKDPHPLTECFSFQKPPHNYCCGPSCRYH
ncbi:hypothetical protein ACQJBY_057413 [Aegilops geniculata]